MRKLQSGTGSHTCKLTRTKKRTLFYRREEDVRKAVVKKELFLEGFFMEIGVRTPPTDPPHFNLGRVLFNFLQHIKKKLNQSMIVVWRFKPCKN